MPKCDKIAVFPQFPDNSTCWFNAIVMAAMFSDYSRNMLLANQDKWSNMSPALWKLLQRFLHKKTRSTDHKFFLDEINPHSLLGHLHQENPGEFYMHKPEGDIAIIYLPRFYNFLGARKSIQFLGNAGNAYDDKIDLHLFGVHDYVTTSRRENGDLVRQYRYKKMLWHFFQKFRLEDDYDFFTVSIVEEDSSGFTLFERAWIRSMRV